MSIRHPSDRKLEEWLQTGEPARVGSHMVSCERCEAILNDQSELGTVVARELARATEPPAGLIDTMRQRVPAEIRRREAMAVFTDLLGLGWHTVTTLTESDGSTTDE